MYKNVLQNIENIDVWPIISLSIFFFFFLCMAFWWWHMDKDHVKRMSEMPLEDDDDDPRVINEDSGRESQPKNSKKGFGFKLAFTALFMLFGSPLFAQSTGEPMLDSYTLFFIVVGAVIIVSILVLVVAIYLLQVLKALLAETQKQKAEEEGVVYVAEPSWWEKFTSEATDAVPLEEEETILLDHEYDGIRELDNHLPPWWKWLFYASIAWGVVYLFAYHVIGALPLQDQEYNNEVAAAEAAASVRLAAAVEEGTLIDENTVEFVKDEASLADGEKIYQTNCAACHKPDGGGSIGPNLTDEYWLHGGGIREVFSTVKYGVVEKGMIPWEPVLTAEQMQNVSAYILTLQGTNPPGAKEAQGEVWVEE